MTRSLGIDIGGSGIKGAVVDIRTGKLVGARVRHQTPDHSTPDEVATVVARIVKHFAWKGPVGCGMPGPIIGGRVLTANNIDKSWLGVVAHSVLTKAVGHPVRVINDADAAGLAEMQFGAGRRAKGVVVLITLGTGIGSALFVDGVLVPNTEFGQIEVDGVNAERIASARIRKKKNMSWKKWSKHVQEYLDMLESLLWPDLIIIGGGVSRKAKKFLPRIRTRARLVPARLGNEAGIIGAALVGARK